MDVGTVLAAVGSSTLIATGVSALVSWKIATGQQQVEREKLNYEREKHEHEKRSRTRDDARSLCQQVVDELTFMAASAQLVHNNWLSWQACMGDETTADQARQVYEDVTTVNAHMPRLLSDIGAASYDVLSQAAWQELQERLLKAHQTYGHLVLNALNPGEFPHEWFGNWLLVYGRANMTARRLIAEIG